MSGIAEFLLMVRWLRSIDSLIISRLRSAVILLFSSMIQSFLMRLYLVLVLFAASTPPLQKARSRPIVLESRCKDKEVYFINQIIS